MTKIKNNIYKPEEIEPKWQAKWQNQRLYQPDLDSANLASPAGKQPFYNLMMFPYPSAEGLHIGGVRTFGGVDIFGRFQRMRGKEVFQPFGLDGFGIHAENYALKIGAHPMEHSEVTEANYYRQVREAAIGVDWSRTVETYKPEYYKWTQWLFLQLFKAGLAYRKKSPVNFCPGCKTVLADEQVIDGQCERCSSVVEKRDLEQWFFRITKYAERLLNNIETLNWTDKVRIAQKNWIGKKTGINITYKVEKGEAGSLMAKSKENSLKVTVFTTRPDTNFGATFIALAPESDLVSEILKRVQDDKKRKEIEKYVTASKMKSELDRQSEGKEKTGVFTGFYAINQLTGYRMPIWISDFVLAGFGTGALVGVPGHDKRDFEFANKFGLEIRRVVVGKDGDGSPIIAIEQVQEEEGTMINSGFLDGLDTHVATEKIMDYMEEKGYGKREVTYHLRDWLISRQRYWGPPIPMIFCEKCAKAGKSWFTTDEGSKAAKAGSIEESVGWYPEEKLPVTLPHIKDFKPLGTGKAPLANHPEFYKATCPACGSEARRETDVSDTFLDSAWYFLRYLATDWEDVPFPSESFFTERASASRSARPSTTLPAGRQGSGKKESAKKRSKFLPVTMYIGGAEHSVLHLLYARFTTMVLHDLGYLDFEEPFSRFYAHGLVIKDGAKMSKSKGNVITPDVYIRKFGADTVRTYLHFLGPFNQDGDFRDSGIEGMNRFLKRVWALFASRKYSSSDMDMPAKRILHQTVKGVTEDMEDLRFNTVIAKLMTWYNFLAKQDTISLEETEVYLKLLAPFAPHMTEELWEQLRRDKGDKQAEENETERWKSIHQSSWPTYDEKYITKDVVTIALQVNGKLRATLQVSAGQAEDQKEIEELANADENVQNFLNQGTVRKVIYIPGKVLNFVVA